MIEFLPPAQILLAGAFLIVVARGRWRTATTIPAKPVIAMPTSAIVWSVSAWEIMGRAD